MARILRPVTGYQRADRVPAGRIGRPGSGGANAGFTLLEMTIALMLLMLVTGVVAGSFGPWVSFRQGLATDDRLATLARTLGAIYGREAATIDGPDTDRLLRLSAGQFHDGQVLDMKAITTLLIDGTEGAGQVLTDGYNAPWRLHVSRRQLESVSGTPLYFHVLAVVSAGRNGIFEAGTQFDADAGVLTLTGDDRGVVFDGRLPARAHYDTLAMRLQKIATAAQAYFQMRYLAHSERDPAIDYFGAACASQGNPSGWDPDSGEAGVLPNGCGTPRAIDEASRKALGMGLQDVVDEQGRGIRYDNSSSAVRNPDNPDPSMRLPPYSARVTAPLPGPVDLSVSIIGSL